MEAKSERIPTVYKFFINILENFISTRLDRVLIR